MSEQSRHRRNEERLERIFDFALDLVTNGWVVNITPCSDGIPYVEIHKKCMVKVKR